METICVRNWVAAFVMLWSGVTAHADERTTAENILHTLDYLAVDYAGAVANGQVINAREYAEQWEFTRRAAQQIAQLAPRPEQAALREQAQTLLSAVQAHYAGTTVAKLSNELAVNLIKEFAIVVAPRTLPDIAGASALYAEYCSQCHGASGAGDGEHAVRLIPPPANLRDAGRQQQRSLYSLYSTITRGVEGTSMVAFTQLTDAQRWALAFYTSRFSVSPEQLERGEQVMESGTLNTLIPDMAAITGTTPAAMRAAQGDDGVALLVYLRAHPEALMRNVSSALDVSLTKLRASVAESRAGRKTQAYDAAVASYLQGYELFETQLRLTEPELAEQIEEKMAKYREYLGGEQPVFDQVNARAQELETLLEKASSYLGSGTMTPLMGAFSAFILLLREGVEAILVLSAIMAFLVKTERRESLRYVHAGWISALALGGVTWVVATQLFAISGANRELTEGITALLAAVILIYMGYWLHRNANIQRWKEFIQGRLQGKSLWTLVFMSFLAVYREVFETILFFETLWLQMPEQHRELLYGIGAAALLLAAITWGMFRFSLRLPLRQFFNVNAVLLFVLAVIFTGKGIAALQEAGSLHLHPVSFPRIDMLGVFPNLEVLGAQAILLLLAGVWLTTGRFKASKPKA